MHHSKYGAYSDFIGRINFKLDDYFSSVPLVNNFKPPFS
jgi:hypothetical protein